MRDICYSHIHVCIFIITISLLSNRCCCVHHPYYEACAPRICGNKSISYPFYIEGEQQAYCGYPGFNITCENNKNPLLYIPVDDLSLLIDEIFYDSRTFHVLNTAFRSDADSCGVIGQIRSDLTMHGSGNFVFNDDSRLVLFSNCSRDDERLNNSTVKCGDTNYVVIENDDLKLGVANEQCKRGFVLNWNATDCRDCNSTGGRCGYNSTLDLFRCFCPDRPHYKNCAPSQSGNTAKILVALFVIIPLLICISLIYAVWRVCRKKYNKKEAAGETNANLLYLNLEISNKQHIESSNLTTGTTPGGEMYDFNLPQFSFSSISAATNNFSPANKLGEGGFGPVYKGNLINGHSVAVKRLSTRSGQGLEELRNETVLIAKLQHRNLVRILGCCIEQDEKILIYEYLPNKSLDLYIFDPSKQFLLDWSIRVQIIEGIAQGLLYLHKHSRLRIVHRDLKASNILLDDEMNPKISDFGMARIFGEDELQANTNRIVGTYGYMSPEYAMEGLFSVKSDVFAFGVMLLEILSGKKNTGFRDADCLNLLGYAWELWNTGKVLDLFDSNLELPAASFLPQRYIHVGLLCVQESPAQRPTMSDVIAMFSNELIKLASPNRPPFITGGNLGSSSVIEKRENFSVNDISTTVMDGR